MAFQKAVRATKRLRITLTGPPGSGKTMTALKIASGLGGRIALIDSEKGSASLYSGDFDFDTDVLGSFDPRIYVEKIQEAEKAGYPIIIIDSLSQAWNGKGGILELVEKFTARSKSKNAFTEGWSQGTPLQNQLIDAIMSSSSHVITTMRTKVEYVIENDSRTGKMTPRKIGLAPVQRQDIEYEFDIVGEMDMDNNLIVAKTRWSKLAGEVIPKPGRELGEMLAGWLNETSGEPAAQEGRQGGIGTPGRNGTNGHHAGSSAPASSAPAPLAGRPEPRPAVPAPAPAPIAPVGLATQEQVESLQSLMNLAGMSEFAVRAALAKRGVSRLESLTVEDAQAMIFKLRAHVEGSTAVEQIAQRIEGASPEEAAVGAGAREGWGPNRPDRPEPPSDDDDDEDEAPDSGSPDDFVIPDQPRRAAAMTPAERRKVKKAEAAGQAEPAGQPAEHASEPAREPATA